MQTHLLQIANLAHKNITSDRAVFAYYKSGYCINIAMHDGSSKCVLNLYINHLSENPETKGGPAYH